MLGWLLAILAVLTVAFFLLTGTDAGLVKASGWERWAIIGGGVLMAGYALLLLSGFQGQFGRALRDLGIWALLALALIIGYSFRADLANVANRVTTELAPPGSSVEVSGGDGPVAVKIRRGPGNHFTARGDVDGSAVSFLVDTGASTVVLKPADAARAGIDIKQLSFTVAVQTANGTTYAAPIRLKSVAVGPIRLHDVEALIAKPGNLNENLLGISFLRRLRSYEFAGEFLTLRE